LSSLGRLAIHLVFVSLTKRNNDYYARGEITSLLYYTIKRILMMPAMLLVISLLIFCMLSLSPIDPAEQMLPSPFTQEQRDELHRRLGLDQPLPIQYVNWVTGVLRGDFGTSYNTRSPVLDDIASRIPVSLSLALITTLVVVIIGVPIGILCAVKQYTWFDTIANAISKVLGTVPSFWLAMILLLVFAQRLRILPVFGIGTWRHWVLPVTSMSLPFIAHFVRVTRSSMLDCIRQDYVKTARSKGAAEGRVIFRDAMKNALLPLITMTGMQFAMLMGGAVVVERIYAMPGLGMKVLEAIHQKDIPMIMACTVILSTVFMVVTLIIDLAYALVDPRIKSTFVKAKRKDKTAVKVIATGE
jgi:peptide/nickel transport system permease protein